MVASPLLATCAAILSSLMCYLTTKVMGVGNGMILERTSYSLTTKAERAKQGIWHCKANSHQIK